MPLPQEIIAIKRDGAALSTEQIIAFVEGVTSGAFADYQASAMLMAIVCRGMNVRETRDLTNAMMRSGLRYDFSELPRPKVDKHSTGGVGDKVSLILAPAAAALGLCVPMLSGRGLGHTGGTLDKLESIPGFQTRLEESAFRKQLSSIHCGIIGQTEQIVPADRKLYALRDVTATVESIPLVTASILSKKLAEGIDSLVMDIKCGRGAFMKTREDARALAESIVNTATALGCPCSAVITRMEQPLGRAVGNTNEVIEAIECLKGQGPSDVMEVTAVLIARMLVQAGLATSAEEGLQLFTAVIEDGTALKTFRSMIQWQGGDVSVIDDYSRFPQPNHNAAFIAENGVNVYVSGIDAHLVGEAARILGAGRSHAEDVIDPSVGIYFEKKVGDLVRPGEPLARIEYNDSGRLELCRERLSAAFAFSENEAIVDPLILETYKAESS